METIWYLIADATSARVYSTPRGIIRLTLLRDFQNPSGRAKQGDLLTDSAGQARPPGGSGNVSSMNSPTDPREVEAQTFARELARMLDEARAKNEFDALVLAAPPHFLGLLQKELTPQVAQRVRERLNRNLTHIRESELSSHFSGMVE